jgi:hypothetical protein
MRPLWLLGSVVGLTSLLFAPAGLSAQATTSAEVRGTVTDTAGSPIPDASVLSTNLSNGERWQTTTDSRGRYYLEHLSVGGPYRVEVRAIGFQPAARGELTLSLGQRYQADFTLTPGVVQLPEITVALDADPRINSGRTGPAQIISQETISRLPIPDRNFLTLAVLSPQVAVSPNGGLSFAGQHERYNSIQIDGTTDNDLFAAGGGGPPLGLRAFSPEAVKEIQVITAPFDVRYGNFAGGLINAVTKSGSNRFQGSVFGYVESAGLTGRDSAGNRETAFSNREGGFVLGGPILRDRLAFFVDAGYRRRTVPQEVPAPTSDTTGGADSVGVGIRYETLTRFQNILRNTYGVEPGSFAFADRHASSWSLFGKLTANLGVNSRIELSHNRPRDTAENQALERFRGFYELSSLSTTDHGGLDATRLTWTAGLGRRMANELVMARLAGSGKCSPGAGFPEIEVIERGAILRAGGHGGCLANVFEEKIWELTDNLSVAAGAHRLTVGTHGELLSLADATTPYPIGIWGFDSLDSLEQGLGNGYFHDVPNPAQPNGDLADFGVRQIGFYGQDEWSPTPHLTVTAGLRFDVPFFRGTPVGNPALASELGIDNTATPSGNVLWSPRLGFNWDASGRGKSFLRGGIGLFAGRPPYFWAAEVYRRSGLGTVRLTCFGSNTPAFTLDPANQPTSCADFEPPKPQVGYFDPSFRFPRNLKLAIGADQRLPWGLVGTIDLLYTRWSNQIEWVDRNLAGPVGVLAGEGGRVLYGTFDPDGNGVPTRLSDAFDAVIQMRNSSGDRSWSLTGQLQKKFTNGTELSAAYTWTDAKNRNDASGDRLFSTFAFSTVDGTEEGRSLRTSIWSVPHKVTLLATMNLPLNLRLGLFYIGESGRPFTYRVFGDANADGVGGVDARNNDPAYVPRDASDITLADPLDWPVLDSIIRTDSCLERQRGHLVERNSCRSPWIHDTRARLTAALPLTRGQRIEVSADLFNMLNFLDSDWGRARQQAQDFGNAFLLERLGYDQANARGVYGVVADGPLAIRALDQTRSRWRLQLSARYVF